MEKKETLPDFLKSASKTVLRRAKRKGLSIAISENGQVKIISPNKNSSGEVSLSNKYAGKLSHKIAEGLQEHISKSRNEWDSNI